MRNNRIAGTVLLSYAMALAACSGGTPTDDTTASASEAVVPASQSLPDALDNADGLQTVAEALKVTGIEGVFKNKGSYTLLAPGDDAFAALGDAGKQLIANSDHAALAALLKGHMLTGYVTPKDLSAAIDASKDGQVKMAALDGSDLVFAKTDSGITVTAQDGSQAVLQGDPVAAGESVAIPISSVLKKM